MVCESKLKSLIIDAFVQLMGGIIRLALRNGVTCTELVDVCKLLYVKIAAEEYGIRGRETNDSRIEVMTGIDRKEVKKIKQKVQGTNTYHGDPDKMGTILSEWHSNPLYCDEEGPKALAFDGEASFSSLVHEHATGMAAITILREFKRSHVVTETEEGLLRALKQAYIPNFYGHNSEDSPDFINPEAIGLGSSMLTDHINTVFYNLYRTDKKQTDRFDLRATNHAVKKSKVSDFYNYIDKLGMEFLVNVDNWLSKNQASESEESIRLGMGIYSIEGLDRHV